jgi:hypothetical protein
MVEEAKQESMGEITVLRDASALRAKRMARRAAASPRTVPDYSRLHPCEATREELALVGAVSVAEFVAKTNRTLIGRGLLPITQGDYPTTRKRLVKLLDRWRRSIQQ